MENLYNKFVFDCWKNYNGYEQKWMRRITRQTKTQYIADCQHTLALSDKYKKLYNKGSEYLYEIFQHCAKRFRMVNGKLTGQVTHLSNPDGVKTVTLIEDFNIMTCKYKYEELFDIDVREVLPVDSRTLSQLKRKCEIYSKNSKMVESDFYILTTVTNENSYTDCFKEVYEHLNNLFNRPVYMIDEMFARIDTTHERSKYSDSAIHYHMNFFGDDKPVITFKENQKNVTISFWLFEDRVVFKNEDGIDSW